MGQKTNPIEIVWELSEVGILTGMEENYGDKIAEDDKIRKYIHARLSKASVQT